MPNRDDRLESGADLPGSCDTGVNLDAGLAVQLLKSYFRKDLLFQEYGPI